MGDFQDMLMVCTVLISSLNEQLIRDRKCSTISDPKKASGNQRKVTSQ